MPDQGSDQHAATAPTTERPINLKLFQATLRADLGPDADGKTDPRSASALCSFTVLRGSPEGSELHTKSRFFILTCKPSTTLV